MFREISDYGSTHALSFRVKCLQVSSSVCKVPSRCLQGAFKVPSSVCTLNLLPLGGHLCHLLSPWVEKREVLRIVGDSIVEKRKVLHIHIEHQFFRIHYIYYHVKKRKKNTCCKGLPLHIIINVIINVIIIVVIVVVVVVIVVILELNQEGER